ncbi:MAG: hypothetical protein M3Y27_15295 [Acidobacteriota bacterium]|nr:hypothetical protein [Acidobacteriota bacterium]
MIRLLPLFAFALLLGAEDHWVSVRSGPFQVFSNTGDKSAREQLEQLEQFRQGLGVVLGKQDLHLLWPLRIVISKNDKYTVPPGLPLARDAYFGSPAHDLKSHDLKTLARLLIAQNTQRLPAEIENGIVELFSTVEIAGARITLGAALPPAQRTRDWARMHLLVTDPAYSGRARVMISNLEQGSELDTAYKNAFERTSAQIEKQVDDHLAAGTFGTTNVSGRTINATRDFHVQAVDSDAAKLMLADVLLAADSPAASAAYQALHGSAAAEGLGLIALRGHREQEALTLFESAIASENASARAYFEAGVLESDAGKAQTYLQKAAELNPLWAEPPFKLAERESDLSRKAILLAKAASLDPRNVLYWQTLAKTYTAANQFKDAQKAWGGAERAAATLQEREHIRAVRLQTQGERADFEAAERKRLADERAADLQRVKDASMADIHAAEAAARKRLNPNGAAPPQPVDWWSEPEVGARIKGTLQRFDCVGKLAKLVVQTEDGKTVQLLVREPGKIALVNGGENALACGGQKPPRNVDVGYTPKLDKRLGTSGEVVSVEFH